MMRKSSICRAALVALMVLLAVGLCGCFGGDGTDSDSDLVPNPDSNSDYVVLDEVPDWSGDEENPYVKVNGNVPDFDEHEISKAKDSIAEQNRLEVFSKLDKLGRCGSAAACVGEETMPDGERGTIGMVRPSGWQLDKYDFIDNGGYLFNRCHLIAWQLTGQNEEERNLITGTRYMNTAGMLPFENQVASYVRLTGNHVLYRATPVFKGKELVARGVQLEAYSLEDNGKGVSFNVYCYNVQPGVSINYKTGENELDEATLPASLAAGAKLADDDGDQSDAGSGNDDNAESDTTHTPTEPLDVPEGVTYILNTNTMRFHRTDCKGARTIREYNREWFYGTREEAIEKGYIPCGMCEP